MSNTYAITVVSVGPNADDIINLVSQVTGLDPTAVKRGISRGLAMEAFLEEAEANALRSKLLALGADADVTSVPDRGDDATDSPLRGLTPAGRTATTELGLNSLRGLRDLGSRSVAELRGEGFAGADIETLRALGSLSSLFAPEIAAALLEAGAKDAGSLKAWTPDTFSAALRTAGLGEALVERELARFARLKTRLAQGGDTLTGIEVDLGGEAALSATQRRTLRQAGVATLEDWLERRDDVTTSKPLRTLLDETARLHLIGADAALARNLAGAGVRHAYDLARMPEAKRRQLARSLAISPEHMGRMTALAHDQVTKATRYGDLVKVYGAQDAVPGLIIGTIIDLSGLLCIPCQPELSVFTRYAYFLYLLGRTGEPLDDLTTQLGIDLAAVTPDDVSRPDPSLPCNTVTDLELAIRALQRHLEQRRDQATSLGARTAAHFLSYETWRAEEMGHYYPELSALWRDDVLTGESGPWDRGSILRNHTATREALRSQLQSVESAITGARLTDNTPFAGTSYIHTFRRGLGAIRDVLRADEAIQEALAALDADEPGLAWLRLDEAQQRLAAVATVTFRPTSYWLDGSAEIGFLLSLPPVRRREHLARLYDELMHDTKAIFLISASDIQTALDGFPDLSGWTGSGRYRKAAPHEVAPFGRASAQRVIKPANLNGNHETVDRKTFASGSSLTDVTVEAEITLIESRTATRIEFISGELVGLAARVQSNAVNGYRLVIRSQVDTVNADGVRALRHYLALEKTASGSDPVSLATSATTLAYDEGMSYRLRLNVEGSQLRGRVQRIGGNTQPIEIAATDATYANGTIGLVASRSLGALFGPLNVEVKAVTQSVTGAPFYAQSRNNFRLNWDFVYSARHGALRGMASDPPGALTRAAAEAGETPLRGTGKRLRIDEGAIAIDLEQLDGLLDFALAMSFYLRYAVIPARLYDVTMQSGDFDRAAEMIHMLYDERAPASTDRSIYPELARPPDLALTLPAGPDVRLLQLRLGDAYLAQGEWLFRQDSDESRYKAQRLLERVRDLHGGGCGCESRITTVIEEVLRSRLRPSVDVPNPDAFKVTEAMYNLLKALLDGREVSPETLLGGLRPPGGAGPDPAPEFADLVNTVATDLRATSAGADALIANAVHFDVLQQAGEAAMAELELRAGAAQLRGGTGAGGKGAPQPMMAAFGPSRWGGWLGDQGGQGISLTTELYTVPSLTMCVPPNPQRTAQKQQACLLLDLLLACRNVLGFRDDFLPAMRFDGLVRYAASFAAGAREAERDLLSFRQAYEQESFSLLQATNQLALNQSEIGLEQLNVEMALGDERLAELQLIQGTHAAEHYETLLAEGLTTMEQLALTAAWGAAAFSGLAAAGGLLTAAAGAVGTATSISGNPVSIATGVVGIAGTLLGGAGQLAGFASSVSGAASMQAGFERREQEWQFTHEQGLATQASAEVNAQQAALRTTYARRRLDLAALRRDLATDAVQFLNAKFLNAAMFAWMVRTVREQYKRRLGYAITASYMAERALAFELQNPALRLIRFDYFDPRRDGLLGATQLQTDLNALESLRLVHAQRRLQLSKTLSLAAEMPAAFAAFRRSGRIVFGIPMESFDRDFPGHYLRQIKSVKVTIVALIPPREGIRATLSNSGVSTVVVGPPYAAGFESRRLLRRPDSVALSVPHQATGLFVLDYDDPLLLPFEGSGVETGWQLDLPRAANGFDFDTIADVQMTIEYTALASDDLRTSIVAQLDRRRLLDRAFSLRQHFADEWYRLHNPNHVDPNEQMVATLRTRRQDFAPNLSGLEIVHVGVLFVRREGSAEVSLRHLAFTEAGDTTPVVGAADLPAQVITSAEGVISTRAGNAPTTWDDLVGPGHSPVGTWALAIADDDATIARLAGGDVEDILFVITYAGQSPPWPA